MIASVSRLTIFASFVATAMSHMFHPAIAPNSCMSVDSLESGSPVVVRRCDLQPANLHSWDFATDSKRRMGPQAIRILGTKKCLDVKDGVNGDGTKLQIWDCESGNPNQQFDYHNLQWANTDKCVDLTDGNNTDGNQLQIWTCTGGPNQQWHMRG